MKTTIAVLTAVLLCAAFTSCAQTSPNDGLVPRMSAQANLSYTPSVFPTGVVGAPMGSSGTVSPLSETRKTYWTNP